MLVRFAIIIKKFSNEEFWGAINLTIKLLPSTNCGKHLISTDCGTQFLGGKKFDFLFKKLGLGSFFFIVNILSYYFMPFL